MKTQISNKAFETALKVRNLSNVVIFKDEIGCITFEVKTDNGIVSLPEYQLAPHGAKVSDKTPSKWADQIQTILGQYPPVQETTPETSEPVKEESTGLQNDPELQKEINEKLQEYHKEASKDSGIDNITCDPETSILSQYKTLKAKHPDSIILFRQIGSYKALQDDAKVLADITGLIARKNVKAGTTEVSFPASFIDQYLPIIVRSGKRVAICDSAEKPKTISKPEPKKPEFTIEESVDVTTEITGEVKIEKPVGTKRVTEKKPQKKQETPSSQSVEERLSKYAMSMYRRFNVTTKIIGGIPTFTLVHVDDTDKKCKATLVIGRESESLSVYTPESFNVADPVITDFFLRIQFLMKDSTRINKLKEMCNQTIGK